MDIDISKYIIPYIPPPKSEYQKRIEIRYFKRKIKEMLQDLKRLVKKKKSKEEYNYKECPYCGDKWLFKLKDGTKVYQPIILYEREK